MYAFQNSQRIHRKPPQYQKCPSFCFDLRSWGYTFMSSLKPFKSKIMRADYKSKLRKHFKKLPDPTNSEHRLPCWTVLKKYPRLACNAPASICSTWKIPTSPYLKSQCLISWACTSVYRNRLRDEIISRAMEQCGESEWTRRAVHVLSSLFLKFERGNLIARWKRNKQTFQKARDRLEKGPGKTASLLSNF